MEESLYWKVKKKTVVQSVWLVIGTLVLYALIRPAFCDYTDRMLMREILESVKPTKEAIAKTIENNASLSGLRFTQHNDSATDNLTLRKITNSGEVVLFSEPLGTLVVLTPEMNNGEVSWSCYGSPQRNMTPECRK